MLAHSCLFVLLSLMSHIVYICTVLFEQINDDDDDDLDSDEPGSTPAETEPFDATEG